MKPSPKIQQILKEGEGYLVEFKEAPSKLEKEMSAFANASGGVIYIGITDRGEIRSTALTNALKSKLQVSARNCDPPIEIKIHAVGKLVAVEVKESPHKPVRAPDGFYLRTGASSQKLTREEIFRFSIKENRILFDAQLYVDEIADDCLDLRQVERFRNRAQLNTELDNKQLLKNLGCLAYQNQKAYLNFGGLLLFGKDPQKVLPHATTTLLSMENPSVILEQRILRGTLFDQVEKGFLFLKEHLKSRPKIETLQREDVLEYPEFVLRELLVNSIIHRDYFERSADVVLKIFKTHIEFSNPGTISHTLPIASLYGHSYRRNPLIADIFFHANYIERAGTGLLRVKQALKNMRLPSLQLREEGVFFIAILPRVKDKEKAALNQRQEQFLTFSETFFPFSTQDYSKKFKISARSARMDIKELLEQKRIKKIKKGRLVRYEKLS